MSVMQRFVYKKRTQSSIQARELLPHMDMVYEGNVPMDKQGIICPKEGIICPKQGIICPKQDIIYPKQGIICPKQGIICPKQGI